MQSCLSYLPCFSSHQRLRFSDEEEGGAPPTPNCFRQFVQNHKGKLLATGIGSSATGVGTLVLEAVGVGLASQFSIPIIVGTLGYGAFSLSASCWAYCKTDVNAADDAMDLEYEKLSDKGLIDEEKDAKKTDLENRTESTASDPDSLFASEQSPSTGTFGNKQAVAAQTSQPVVDKKPLKARGKRRSTKYFARPSDIRKEKEKTARKLKDSTVTQNLAPPTLPNSGPSLSPSDILITASEESAH